MQASKNMATRGKPVGGMTAAALKKANPDGIATRHGTISIFETDHPISTALARYGEWAEAEVETLSALLRPGDTVLDVGAHVGIFTLAFARAVGAEGAVHAFEPQPSILDHLRRNIDLNGCADIVKTHHCALGAASGYVEIPRIDYSQPGNFGAVHPAAHPGHPLEEGGVPLRRIDDLKLQDLRLIKIDVEGAELEVIEGARATIGRCKPFLSIEAHTIEKAWQTCRVLRDLELETWILATPAFNPANFKGDAEDFFDLAYECAVLGAAASEAATIDSIARIGAILTPASTLDDVARAYVEIPLPGDADFERTSARQNLRRITRERHALSATLDQARTSLAQKTDEARSALEQVEALDQALQSERQSTKRLGEQLASVNAEAQSLRIERLRSANLLHETRNDLKSARQAGETASQALAQERATWEATAERHRTELKAKTIEIARLNQDLANASAERTHFQRAAENLATRAQKLASQPIRTLKNYLIFRVMKAARNHPYLWSERLNRKLSRQLRKKNPNRFKVTIRSSINVETLADEPSSDVMRDIAASNTFDPAFYLTRYPDIEAAGVDPLRHYTGTGWHERRDPSSWFSTSYYLTANPDVAAAGVNPLWHYAVAGKREGRPCYHPGGPMAEIIANLQPLQQQRELRHALAGDPVANRLTAHRLAQALRPQKLLLISLSHDDYRISPGGIQLCLQIEQKAVSTDLGGAMLNLHPRIALPTLVPAEHSSSYELIAALDGNTLGVISAGEVLAAVEMIEIETRIVIHSLLGHACEFAASLHCAARARTAIFWAHDYFAGCSGYALMRNDVAYCGAPPPGSGACGICIHGPERKEHLARMKAMFDAVPFRIVAPSEAARRTWLAATGLAAEVTVHPHCVLIDSVEETADQCSSAPARIAFLGHSRHFKGWTTFARIARAFGEDNRYEFVHLGTRNEIIHGVSFEPVSVAKDGPDAMVSAIARNKIDVALIWSRWPETFGFVACEALAAGARIVVWDGAGNLPDIAHMPDAGLSVPDEAALHAAFENGAIHELAMARRQRILRRDLRFSRISVDLLEAAG